MTAARTELVITADDLGIDARRDDGIFAAHAFEAITQSSMLVRGVNAPYAAARAREVGLPLGLHLDLTETPPCAEPSSVASLLDGRGAKLGKHGLRAAVAAGTIDPEHVAREARAQLDAFEDLVGRRPRHVDGHQHVHVVPAIAACLAALLARAGVRSVRIPSQRSLRIDDPEARTFYRGVSDEASAARALYARCGVRSTEAFVGLDTGGAASDAERLRGAVLALADAASIELMTHPGFPGKGVDAFNESREREHELRVLCALPFSSLIDTFRPASFEELATRGGLR